MIRVCYIVPTLDYSSGWGKWTIELFKEITNFGVEPVIIAPSGVKKDYNDLNLSYEIHYIYPPRYFRFFLSRVGLLEFKDESADSLPHGHKKRLEIGMAVSSEPKLLMLDEVTAGLTAEETKEMCNFIQELSSKYTIIMVEHKIEVVLGLSKRICVMHQGRIIADGTPKEVIVDEKVREVYLRGS